MTWKQWKNEVAVPFLIDTPTLTERKTLLISSAINNDSSNKNLWKKDGYSNVR